MTFNEYSIADLCKVCSSKRIFMSEYVPSGIPFFRGKEISEKSISKENISTELFISNEKYKEIKTKFGAPQTGDILITAVGTIGNVWLVNMENFYFKDGNILWLKDINANVRDRRYLYYFLRSKRFMDQVEATLIGSSQKALLIDELRKIKIKVPDLETQRKIVRVLSALDQKIELNNQQNKTLFELGQKLYVEKFENNKAINKVKLEDFFPVVTGKKDANASSENGQYPFFTCSKAISRIDDYVFDASAILLAGNGDFNVKFYRGKFDAYQRTYVLVPNNPKYLGFLYWAISYSLPKITANYRGSVIKFITKGNIENFKVPFVDNEFIQVFMKYLEKTEKNNRENETLSELRDTLLPKLMSGKINLERINI